MVDAEAFREGVGRLLAEVQRIKAEGDYDAARELFDSLRHAFRRRSCATRWWRGSSKLNMPSYTGFVQPRLERGDRRRRQDHRRRG